MRTPARLLLGLGLVLAGCSAGTVSAECTAAFENAAITDGAEMQTAMDSTLSACGSYDEWVEGLRANPPAAGIDEEAGIDGQMQVMGFCEGTDGPVCEDARERGVIE